MDYNKISATCKRLIDKHGRDITIVQLKRTPLDSAKPWRGDPAPRDVPAATVTTKSVNVTPGSLVYYGFTQDEAELMKRCEQTMLVSGLGVNYALIEEYDEIIDGTTRWRIDQVIRLKPNNIALLYVLGVKR